MLFMAVAALKICGFQSSECVNAAKDGEAWRYVGKVLGPNTAQSPWRRQRTQTRAASYFTEVGPWPLIETVNISDPLSVSG